jgi:hypothetical protein
MKFFKLTDDNQQNCIANEIDNYQMEFNEGNYEYFSDNNWSPDEEIVFIKYHLVGIGLGKFCQYFKNEKTKHPTIFGLPQLVQFCVVCHLHRTMMLNANEIEHLSEPPIPIASLVKIDLLQKKLTLSTGFKLSMIHSTIKSVFDHREKFPYITEIVINQGVKIWKTLFDNSDDDEIKNRPSFINYKLFFESIHSSFASPNALDRCVIDILLKTNPQLSHFFN